MIFAASTAATVACFQVDYGSTPFLCNPSLGNADCPTDFVCCSDDPATLSGKPPVFGGDNTTSASQQPLFADQNNSLSVSGLCVAQGVLNQLGADGATPLTNKCPVPCNPTWESTNPEFVDQMCGTTGFCCQSRQLDPKDCVFDPEEMKWRPATGKDIGILSAQWIHATNQDPGAKGCNILANGNTSSQIYKDCLKNLSVADQRGFCQPDACPMLEDVCATLPPP